MPVFAYLIHNFCVFRSVKLMSGLRCAWEMLQCILYKFTFQMARDKAVASYRAPHSFEQWKSVPYCSGLHTFTDRHPTPNPCFTFISSFFSHFRFEWKKKEMEYSSVYNFNYRVHGLKRRYAEINSTLWKKQTSEFQECEKTWATAAAAATEIKMVRPNKRMHTNYSN